MASDRRSSMATQLMVLAALAATVAVLVAGVLLGSLARGAAQAEALASLGRQADLVAEAYEVTPGRLLRTVRVLAEQGISVAVVTPDGAVVTRSEEAAAAVAGREAELADGGSTAYVVGAPDSLGLARGDVLLVQARPLAAGGSVVLVQARSEAPGLISDLVRMIGLALAAGLAVALLAGWLASRRLARPLQRTAAAAQTLATGDRSVRVTAAGPREVAAVADALNDLAGALDVSEARQREFLLSVSHELRTPLTAVRGFAESVADGVVEGEDARAAGATILAESQRLDRLVSDLLDLARLGADRFPLDVTALDLGALVAAAGVVWTRRCADVGVALRVEPPDGPVPVRADAGRLRQVLDGLLENALRVTPAGAPIVLAARGDGGHGVLEVRDGGPGLTERDCAEAFDRAVLYERYRGVRRVGTGVGLALVAGLAARMGGQATAAGHGPEGGAVFRVRLPSG